MKKKFLVVLFMMAMVLVGCGKKVDLKQIYLDSFNKAMEVDDVKLDFNFGMDLAVGENTVTMNPFKGQLVINNLQSKDSQKIEGYIQMAMDIFGQKQQMDAYIQDGYAYNSSNGMKTKEPFSMGNFENNVPKDNPFTAEDFVEKITMSETDDGYHYEMTFTDDDIEIINQLIALSQMQDESVSFEELTIKDGNFIMDINKDGNIQSMIIDGTMDMQMQGQVLSIKLSINLDMNYDETNIDFPNLEEYIDISEY